MTTLKLEAHTVAKIYNRKSIFQNVSLAVKEGMSFAITGKNGSGKSTLIKILCGVLSPSKGTIALSINGVLINYPDYYPYIGLVSPYLNMYEEFSAEENLIFIKRIRGLNSDTDERIKFLLNDFGIYEHRRKEVRNYSSGMKQRLKYCAALVHQPPILVLDEPTSNLDEYGIETVRKAMKLQKNHGALIFGTNDKDDLRFADQIFSLDKLEIGN
ncbi:MAG: ABC transporter ATP-binding protein [Bacteroidota bacterium]|nr:ABC transporter ATP-binding protein [Bacteroidota bacterium]